MGTRTVETKEYTAEEIEQIKRAARLDVIKTIRGTLPRGSSLTIEEDETTYTISTMIPRRPSFFYDPLD